MGEWTEYLSMDVDYAELPVPILYLYGEHEVDSTATHGRFIADTVRGSESREILAAGHLSPVDNPRFVTATVREFLSDIP